MTQDFHTKKFIVACWNLGYSIATYKTVRGCDFPSHPFPYVVRVFSKSKRIVPGEVVQGDLNLKIINRFANGVVAINTIAARVVDKDGKQKLLM